MAVTSHMRMAFSPGKFHSIIWSFARGGVEQLQLSTETTGTFKLELKPAMKNSLTRRLLMCLAIIENHCWL